MGESSVVDAHLSEETIRELRRLGVAPRELPVLALPATVTIADFVERLRELPDGAGIAEVTRLIYSLPRAEPPPWAVWPDPGDRFSYADYRAAFALINAAPDELARHYAEPPRHLSTEVLALLSLVSPDLAERVDAFRTEIWRERIAMGASPEVVETAQIRWSDIREKLAGAVISGDGE
jgi:hypothetical protein